MAVDTVTDYVQGSVKSFTYAKDQNDITLTNLSTGKSTTYDISSKAPPSFMARTSHSGAGAELLRHPSALRRGCGDAAGTPYPGSTTTEGV